MSVASAVLVTLAKMRITGVNLFKRTEGGSPLVFFTFDVKLFSMSAGALGDKRLSDVVWKTETYSLCYGVDTLHTNRQIYLSITNENVDVAKKRLK